MSESPEASSIPGATSAPEVRRLGRNVGGYNGETIDIRAALIDCESAAQNNGWRTEGIEAGPDLSLPAFIRLATIPPSKPVNIYISAGIHGDEPATSLAAKQLLLENRWPVAANLWMCPCLNPTGFMANRRENHHGTDLNRQYLQPQAQEIVAHISWLQSQPSMDLCLCLHEDWESHGFYLYELNPDGAPSVSERILHDVSRVCPIDCSESIEGRPAKNGLILPTLDIRTRLQWPEALFLIMHKTRLCYTFEAPSDFPLLSRVEALVVAVRSAINCFAPSEG
jgi:murein peptide amidase A